MIAGTSIDLTLTSQYSLVNNRQWVYDNLSGSAQGRIDFGYDQHSMMRTIELVVGGVEKAQVDLAYDHLDRLTNVSRISGTNPALTTTFTYDTIVSGLGSSRVAMDQVKQIEHRYGTTQLSIFSYGYNLESELTHYIGPEGSLTYGYDETHQLTSVAGPNPENFSFDANGNRDMLGWVTGPNNRLLEDPNYTYQYDDEGNRTRRTHKATGEYEQYFWDHRNRLSKVEVRTSGGSLVRELRNTYDALDRLIGRWLDSHGAGPAAADQFFTVYDGEHSWADLASNETVLKRYLFGPEVDQIFARWGASTGVDDRCAMIRHRPVATECRRWHISYRIRDLFKMLS